MTSVAIAEHTINVPFHGTNLFLVSINNEPYVPMKPVVEGMGMVWAAQFVKLKQRFAKGISEIEIPSAGGKQLMICLAFRKFAAWLSSIQPNKVRPEIRDKVIQYQEECDDVLY
ncbi:phage antirepressor N-terminal domain-containing protein, partial [Escherichia coli]|nr:phage antirepressor N-terminal domain-containing protein [Escherichia coli]